MNGLTLRRAIPTDAEAFARMMTEPEVFGGVLQIPYADAEYWRTYPSYATAAGEVDLHLVAELDGHLVVGSAGLHPTAPMLRRRHAFAQASRSPRHTRAGVCRALVGALYVAAAWPLGSAA